jgi:queuine tRNA-ribosyltransferase
MTKRHELVRTRGGALAVRSLAEGEVMHPGVGPLIEAERLYVRQSRLAERLATANVTALVVFDVGLGAGSNALCAWDASEGAGQSAARLELVSFERDLGALELALAHGRDFALEAERASAARAILEHGAYETVRTSWRLQRGDVIECLARESVQSDIVFWDPFSVRVNAPLWTIAAFQAIRRKAGPRCTLFTYSASTATRVALLLAGWAVGIGEAIGDKAATTAAATRVEDLVRPLDRRWLARLDRALVPLPSDAPADAKQIVASLPQFLDQQPEDVSRRADPVISSR